MNKGFNYSKFNYKLEFFSWGRMLSLRQQRTSVLSAPERRVLATRVAVSTGWSRISCARVAISLTTMALVVNPFMVPDSTMRTLSSLIASLVYFLWRMLGPAPMAVSSSSPVPRPVGLMENTLCSEKLSKEWMLLEKYDFM